MTKITSHGQCSGHLGKYSLGFRVHSNISIHLENNNLTIPSYATLCLIGAIGGQ